MPGMFSRDHNLTLEPTEDTHSVDEAFRKLKDLPIQRADSSTPGYRDTIDSVLSKYGAVRNKILHNPLFGLVLSAELVLMAGQQPSAVLADKLINLRSTGTQTNIPLNMGGPHTGAAQDIKIDDAEDISRAVASAPGGSHSLIRFTSPNDDSEKFDSDGTGTSWDDPEDTLLDDYAESNTNWSHTKIESNYLVEEEVAVKLAVKTAVVLEKSWDPLLSKTDLTMSPIVQVAIIEPQTAIDTAQGSKNNLNLGSASDFEEQHAPALDRDTIEALSIPSLMSNDEDDDSAPPLESLPDSCITFLPHMLHDAAETEVGSLLQEYHASAGAVLPDPEMKAQHEDERRDTEHEVTDQYASRSLASIPDQQCPEEDGGFYQKKAEKDFTTVDKEPEEVETVLPFFAYLEQDRTNNYILNAGFPIMLTAAALAGHLFW